VPWVAAAAWLIAAPFAGMAEAEDAAQKPTAADMAAANRTILSVIPSSVVEAQRRPRERVRRDVRPVPSLSGAVNRELAGDPDVKHSEKYDARTGKQSARNLN
jgi:hypothetical protein